jgi:hypothetical protein
MVDCEIAVNTIEGFGPESTPQSKWLTFLDDEMEHGFRITWLAHDVNASRASRCARMWPLGFFLVFSTCIVVSTVFEAGGSLNSGRFESFIGAIWAGFGVCAVLAVFALWNWKTVMPEGAGTWRHKGMTLVQQLSLPVYSVVCCVWSLLCLERTKQVHPILSQENVLSDNFMFEAKAPVFLFLLTFMIMVRQKWHAEKMEHSFHLTP